MRGTVLDRLKLINYRGFEEHTLNLNPITILVGRNNAGKSTIVEALRLISIVTERISGLNFSVPPKWTNIPRRERGVTPSLENLGIDFRSICYRYGSPPVSLVAHFINGERIEFFANDEGEGFALIYDQRGEPVRSKVTTRDLTFPKLNILPQVAPLESSEPILSEDYVRRNMSSPLSPRHFRNQLRLNVGAYRSFRSLAEETWPGLQIQSLEGAKGVPGQDLFLGIRDGDFVAEIANMGQGLQMWLQTMWFLARTSKGASIVLDEPDIYMHPDLQRRMIRLVRNRYSQVIVATHSIEIMAEVQPSEILIVDREKTESNYANSDPGVQTLIDRLGGIHNIHLARLWTAKRCLLVEGKDVSYLKLVHDIIYPDALLPFDQIPNLSIGGWGGWNYAIGSSLFIKNSFKEDVTVYCILDSDFHSSEEVAERKKTAKERLVQLHIWRRKEIENYFIVPSAIVRILNKNMKRGLPAITIQVLCDELDKIADDLKIETQDSIAEEINNRNRARGAKSAIQEARAIVEEAFDSFDGKLGIVSGKKIIGKLAQWSQQQYGVTLGLTSIIRELKSEEVPSEVRTVIDAIQNNDAFGGN